MTNRFAVTADTDSVFLNVHSVIADAIAGVRRARNMIIDWYCHTKRTAVFGVRNGKPHKWYDSLVFRIEKQNENFAREIYNSLSVLNNVKHCALVNLQIYREANVWMWYTFLYFSVMALVATVVDRK